MRKMQAQDLMQSFLAIIVSSDAGQDIEKSLACVLFKKYYLDGRAEEKDCEQMNPAQAQ